MHKLSGIDTETAIFTVVNELASAACDNQEKHLHIVRCCWCSRTEMCVLVLVLVLMTMHQTRSREITLKDALHYTGRICGDPKIRQKLNSHEDDPTNTDKPCSCDPLCARYGDCCQDSEFFIAEEQLWGASPASCAKLGFVNVFAITSCQTHWDNSNSRTKCEQPDITYPDPLLDVPVTSRRTNITYFNGHCAICNGDFDVADIIWPVNFGCDVKLRVHQNKFSSVGNGLDSLDETNPTFASFGSDFEIQIASDKNSYEKYDSPPVAVTISLTQLFYDKDTRSWYLNSNESNPKCDVHISEPVEDVVRYCKTGVIGSCVEDWNDPEVESKCLAYTDYWCDGFQVYRNPFCAYCNHVTYSASPICLEIDIGGRPFQPDSFSVLLDWSRLSSLHSCLTSERYDPFEKKCRETPSIIQANKEDDSILDVITIIGISLSMVCLILHLIVFILTPNLRNFPAMNLASLCMSLLFLYSCFVASGFMEPPCVAVAVILHYSLLATFCWTAAIAFDIWTAIRKSTSSFKYSSGTRWVHFCVYSAFCWTVPVLVLTPALIAECVYADSSFRPGYGVTNCWIGNRDALLVFVVAPLCIVMTLNAAFFSWSSCLIYFTKSKMAENSSDGTDFRLFVRLALIMGLTWITGLIAGVTGLKVFWHIFVILNTLKGLFIFVAFSCKKRILKEMLRGKIMFSSNTVKSRSAETARF